MDLSSVREEYVQAGLDRADLADDPFEQFDRWYGEVAAAGYWEPNAMVLSTSDEHGAPTARNVLLKGSDEERFVFYTNYRSAKGDHIAANPAVALTFSWTELRRQVRVQGRARKVDGIQSDTYFASRPRGSQLGAWASDQSSVMADREAIDTQAAEMQARFGGGPIPRPSHWGGYAVDADELEFWQGREDRLHDRFRYRRTSDGATWHIDRLAP